MIHTRQVAPPAGWRPRRRQFPDLRTVKINTPIRQHVFGSKGAYRCILVEQKEMSVDVFQEQAVVEAEATPALNKRVKEVKEQEAKEKAQSGKDAHDADGILR